MFEKFGEFDSWQEINKAAVGFLEEGDAKSLFALAKENGFGEAEVSDYVEGETPTLCTATSAAIARLALELENTKENKDMMRVIYDMTQSMVMDELGEDKQPLSEAVTKKGRRMDKILEKMREEARKNQHGGGGCVCGTDRDLQKRIREYYGVAA